MTMAEGGSSPGDGWLDKARQRLADVAGEARAKYDLCPAHVEMFLRLARVASHGGGERKNAPHGAYLVGVAKRRHASARSMSS